MRVFIMAGGSGTRLAPLSLTIEGQLPKQFLALVSERTLLQEAVDRIPEGNEMIIIPEKRYQSEVLQQVGDKAGLLAEPFGCNTATAIALAIKDLPDDEVALFLPADHMMSSSVFSNIFKEIDAEAKKQSKIIVIGITPDRAETGYGYIKVNNLKDSSFFEVEQFVEKPDLVKAQEYLQEEGYFWNAGMFCFQAGVMKSALRKHAPDIWDIIKHNPVEEAYQLIKEGGKNISIDYAVMEKEAANILLCPAPLELEWNDVGGWKALQKYLTKDQANNTHYGQVEIANSQNCQVMNYSHERDLAVSGLESALVINTDIGLLVTNLMQAARAKEIIPALEAGEERFIKEAERVIILQKTPQFVAVIGYSELEISVSLKKIEVKGLNTTL